MDLACDWANCTVFVFLKEQKWNIIDAKHRFEMQKVEKMHKKA